MSICKAPLQEGRSRCQCVVDRMGVHSSICAGLKGAQMERHNKVRDYIAYWCQRAGLHNVKTEAWINGRRADVIMATGWGENRSRTLVIDVAICHGLAPSGEGRVRAVDCERQKLGGALAKYCERHPDTYIFKPFVVEVLGRMGETLLAVAEDHRIRTYQYQCYS